MNSSKELLNNITEYKKEKNISGPFDICWHCKETNLSEDLRGINCDHKYHHHIIICLCKKCRDIHNIEDNNWVEELSKECSENKIEMSKDIIRKSYLKFYKKKYLYHYFVFDYGDTIKIVCNDCVSNFIKDNVYEKAPKDKSDEMLRFLETYQDLIWDKDDKMELSFNDVFFDFEREHISNTNVFRLNYAGTEDYFYFTSISDDELQTYMYNLDEYPIYVYYTDVNEIEKIYDNFYDLMNEYIDDKNLLSEFSRNSIEQEIPIAEGDV